MIARLSDLLRMSLERVGVQEVPLKEELDFLSKYLEIEQTRFRDRLTVVFDVQAESLHALVPNLLLQPRVENAIKHGIGPRPTPGQIAVRARCNGAMLELDVQDNGATLIRRDFGSIDDWRADLKASGMAGRGWAWTAYDWDEGRLFNYVGDAQNTYPIWNATPLVALDVYEHAYFLDYRTDRASYIDAFFDNLDWNVVNGWITQYGIQP